jgi:uncharacterized protein YggT (Ycf19 family)
VTVTYDDRERVVETDTVEEPPVRREVYREPTVRRETTVVGRGPTAGETLRRIVALLFGVLQALLILRIVLLLLVANQGNDIVSFILGVTDPFVEPFRGMFSLDRVTANQGSTLDVGAIVALIGWTLIEALVLAVLSLGARRGEDATV